ncbi:hypothetical protein [Sulfurovum sp.]|uniref:hypothetical protein n=1 Tax=Sulfurovum sp. TaxID=1969726 RepID=UPI0028682955|nr:hypothetical protein [Sulfurovum sp.]
MKNNLGKTILFLLLFVLLQAEDFSYDFKVDNTQPYVKEPVLLTLDIQQTNKELVLLFTFDLKKSVNYQFQRLNIQETDSYHNAQIHYEYLIYPLKEGEIKLEFELLKKATTDESVAYSFSGDRDNIKGLVTTDTIVSLPPLTLKVKSLPEGTLFVGDFTLTHQLKSHTAEAHEPLPFQVYIEGQGYPPLLDSILPKEGVFTRFTEPPLVKSIATSKGTQNSVSYPMALSHSQSFTLPSIKLKTFDPKTERSYFLSVPSQYFDIQEVAKDTLLDKEDTPKPFSMDWSWLTKLFAYLVVFGAGYLTAVSWKWQKKKVQTALHPLHEKISKCKNEKALLQVLMATDDKRFASCIEKLESSLYGDGKINLNKVKQEAQDLI